MKAERRDAYSVVCWVYESAEYWVDGSAVE
jgi:hypothetical protein